MLKIIINLFLILFLTNLELSKITSRIFLNPYLCFVVLSAFSKNNLSFLWPLLGGIILDSLSIINFPIFTISFLFTFLIVKFFNEKIITFRNFISLIIFSVGSIILYNFIFLIFNLLIYFLKIEDFFIVFNRKYFIYLFANIIFTFLLLFIFRRKYEPSI